MSLPTDARAVVPPGTPMHKPVPPRLVEPYLTGRRSILAGFAYRAAESSFLAPSAYYHAFDLGYDGSEFSPGMDELYLLRWPAVGTEALVPGDGVGAKPGLSTRRPTGRNRVTEYYAEPTPLPVGAEIYRISAGRADFVARYDGQVWLRPVAGN